MKDFFSLSKTSTNIQCFSCGIILTKFSPDTPSFVSHLLPSPNCKHLHLDDDLNKPIHQTEFTTLNTHISPDNKLKGKPAIFPHTFINEAGFTILLTPTTQPETCHSLIKRATGCKHCPIIPTSCFKCPSCYGTYQVGKSEDDPWQFHAQYFPYCPHVLKSKPLPFVKHCLKQNTHKSFPKTQYQSFLRRHLQYVRPDTFNKDILHTSNLDTLNNLLQSLTKYHLILMSILPCYASTMMHSSS